MKLGLTLPSFTDDPSDAIAVAVAAERAGVDGVFVYDHLFRDTAAGPRRPALECVALLGAVTVATTRIAVGTLVARASLRPVATLVTALDTLQRLATDRLVVGLGAGDSKSERENTTFGLPFGTMLDRVERLEHAVTATRDRGFPVWVGGTSHPVRDVAAQAADGWNQWGGPPDQFRARAAAFGDGASHQPFTCTWGGLVILGGDDVAAAGKRDRLAAASDVIAGGPDRVAAALEPYATAGADWLILGPVDSRDPANATLIGEEVAPRLRAGPDGRPDETR
ncbi:MAG TPA: LLM class flavin-dependent oxidoreductase [Acidimicrobiia bacterium]|nr:LLM class flavin-dependent oxidoreductase [Acidimicrobiia bacterium]